MQLPVEALTLLLNAMYAMLYISIMIQYNNSKLIPVLSDQIVYKNIERHRAYHDMFFGIN